MIRYRGIVYRAHDPAWPFSPLSGEDAKIHGGRFNPAGTPVLYASTSAVTAIAEFNQGFPHRPQVMTLCAFEVDCEGIVDLTDPDTLSRWKITQKTVENNWEMAICEGLAPPSWSVMAVLLEKGVSGILVPSLSSNAPEGAQNLVLWNWGAALPYKITLIDAGHRLLTENPGRLNE